MRIEYIDYYIFTFTRFQLLHELRPDDDVALTQCIKEFIIACMIVINPNQQSQLLLVLHFDSYLPILQPCLQLQAYICIYYINIYNYNLWSL